jgi:phytoene synthase
LSLAEAYAHCGEIARAHQRDLWLGSLFASAPARPRLHALIALSHELGGLRANVRDPRAGEIRLVWWREALTGARDDEAQGNPVAAAALDTLKAVRPSPHLIENALAARQFDLYDDAFPSVQDLEAYLGETRSGLLQIAALVLSEGRDPGAAEASGYAGVALGLIELMRSLALPRPPMFVPHEVGAAEDFAARRASPAAAAALRRLIDHARRRLGEAEAALAKLPRPLSPAYAGLATAPLWLAALARTADDPFARPVEVAPWRRQWALWRWMRR